MQATANFQLKSDLQRLYFDIVKAAEISGSPYNKRAIWIFLYAYREFFSGSAVSFRTSTRQQDKRSLNVRYLEHDVLHDPHRIAYEAGLIKRNGHPIDELLPALRERFPLNGYGIDCSADYGFEKIRAVFDDPQPLSALLALDCLPPAVAGLASHFARHGLRDVHMLDVDYRNTTAGIHFLSSDLEELTTRAVARLIQDLGLELPPPEWLVHCAISVLSHFTFSWDSDGVERLGFCTCAEAGDVPVHLDPLLARFVEQVPVLSTRRMFIYGIKLTRDAHFITIENDYTGTVCSEMRNTTHI